MARAARSADAPTRSASREILHAMRRDIGADAGAQPQRKGGIAFPAALDLRAQEVGAQPAADARKTDVMDVSVGAQRTAEPCRGVIEPLGFW